MQDPHLKLILLSHRGILNSWNHARLFCISMWIHIIQVQHSAASQINCYGTTYVKI